MRRCWFRFFFSRQWMMTVRYSNRNWCNECRWKFHCDGKFPIAKVGEGSWRLSPRNSHRSGALRPALPLSISWNGKRISDDKIWALRCDAARPREGSLNIRPSMENAVATACARTYHISFVAGLRHPHRFGEMSICILFMSHFEKKHSFFSLFFF